MSPAIKTITAREAVAGIVGVSGLLVALFKKLNP
jgi:hypothetical protein